MTNSPETSAQHAAREHAASHGYADDHVAAEMLTDYVKERVPAMLWGSPGIGKSDIAAQVAERQGLQLIDIRLTLMESVDLRGLPVTVDGVTRFLPPEELNETTKQPSLILWDEINAAPMSVQVASYQAILNNRIGNFHFGPDTRHAAAGNRLSDKAGANRMSSALANRMAHIDVEADPKAWLAWAGRPGSNISPMMMAFIGYRGADWLNKPVPDAREFASPRSWAMADKFSGYEPRKRQRQMKGIVSEAAAGEFEAFARLVADLDTPATIVRDPMGARLPAPDNIGGHYGVTIALASFIDRTNAKAAAQYVLRLPSEEFRAMFAMLLLKRDPRIVDAAFAEIAPKAGLV